MLKNASKLTDDDRRLILDLKRERKNIKKEISILRQALENISDTRIAEKFGVCAGTIQKCRSEDP